ncbi:GDP/GTP exchange factor Sec2p-domain-containing protein [Fennellomyces sp. T-0311]|nr:GDP/GTP exchange factor Sec2p-domain-containing protein [Fennellomyces sp. T-0311]
MENPVVMDSSVPAQDAETAKDIAGLYSKLQAVIEKKVHNDPMNPEAKFIPLPPSLPMSPSSSSPTPLRITPSTKPMSTPRSSSSSEDKDHVCSCQDILSTKESTQCELCQRDIPIMADLHKERELHKQEIKELEIRVQEEQSRIARQLDEIEALQVTVAEVEKRLDVKESEFQALQNDMELLNDKYVDEIERVAEIQHSKDMVENELEDLSRRLFEEANGMVANEKREKHNLEIAQKHLEKQLQETQERLAAEQMQLKELRLKMEEMAQEQQRSASPVVVDNTADCESTYSSQTDPEHRAARDLAGILSDRNSVASLPAPSIPDTIDQMLLTEFEEFVKYSASLPLKKLHTISFLKYCQAEDVEPCLRFGANARLSAKKIAEAIVMNTCFIEETPPGFAEEQAQRPADMPLRISASKVLLWERISNGGNTNSFVGACQACGRQDQSPLPYRFRTSYFDDWACIDRFCRDRLVAVCEFYVFIRNVRQGYYGSRTVPDLYQEAMRLRLQMFYARMGALPWTLRSLGVKTDELGKATPVPQIRIPPTVSESSPLPRTAASTTSPKIERVGRPTSIDGRSLAMPSPESKDIMQASTAAVAAAATVLS